MGGSGLRSICEGKERSGTRRVLKLTCPCFLFGRLSSGSCPPCGSWMCLCPNRSSQTHCWKASVWRYRKSQVAPGSRSAARAHALPLLPVSRCSCEKEKSSPQMEVLQLLRKSYPCLAWPLTSSDATPARQRTTQATTNLSLASPRTASSRCRCRTRGAASHASWYW
jgi:hypothetical protein